MKNTTYNVKYEPVIVVQSEPNAVFFRLILHQMTRSKKTFYRQKHRPPFFWYGTSWSMASENGKMIFDKHSPFTVLVVIYASERATINNEIGRWNASHGTTLCSCETLLKFRKIKLNAKMAGTNFFTNYIKISKFHFFM